MYGLSSFIEIKMSIPPAAHTTVTMYVRRTMSVFALSYALFFSLTSYPAEIAYFSSPTGEISNFVRLMELYCNKNVDPSRSPSLKIVSGKRFERRNF